MYYRPPPKPNNQWIVWVSLVLSLTFLLCCACGTLARVSSRISTAENSGQISNLHGTLELGFVVEQDQHGNYFIPELFKRTDTIGGQDNILFLLTLNGSLEASGVSIVARDKQGHGFQLPFSGESADATQVVGHWPNGIGLAMGADGTYTMQAMIGDSVVAELPFQYVECSVC